ncbi:MAG: DUF4469 domain-containing protein [Treponema sp.]|jgi:hypothetical protein|nr:DUF4469 domain-containing protein [Treponema sp.]
MPRITDDQEVLHELPLWLYPNHLDEVEGKYLARPRGLQMLSTREVCVKAVKDGYPGSVDDMEKSISWFLDTAVFDLLDGYGVNFGGYFSTRLRVGGAFENELEGFLPEKHPIGFTFATLSKLRNLLSRIRYRLEGVAGDGSVIAEFIDNTTSTVNEKVTPTGVFTILGAKIKIAGDPDKTGIYFSTPSDPGVTIKVAGNLVENSPAKIIAVVPDLSTGKKWTVQICTQYSGSGKLLKEVRTIESDFKLDT